MGRWRPIWVNIKLACKSFATDKHTSLAWLSEKECRYIFNIITSGLFYKHITIVKDNSEWNHNKENCYNLDTWCQYYYILFFCHSSEHLLS